MLATYSFSLPFTEQVVINRIKNNTMKTIVINLIAVVFSTTLSAQNASLELIAQDVESPNGYETYRLYARLSEPGSSIHAVFGDELNDLRIQSSEGFYQHPFGGHAAANVNQSLVEFDANLNFDSWITLGYDNDESTMWEIGIDFDAFENGNGIQANNGAWFLLPDDQACLANEEGLILLAQFTFKGKLSGVLNLQGFDANRNAWQQRGLTFEAEPLEIEEAQVEVTPLPNQSEMEIDESTVTVSETLHPESGFTFFPNPYHSGELTIVLDNSESESNLVECFDASGKLVLSESISGFRTQIQLNEFTNLSPGVYLLRVNNSTRQLLVQ